jgi:hypothetical protein
MMLSEARHGARGSWRVAASHPVSRRPTGCSRSGRKILNSPSLTSIGVLQLVGCTELTRILCFPSSLASYLAHVSVVTQTLVRSSPTRQ